MPEEKKTAEEINREILETNREIAESVRYIKNHYRFELLVTAVKWFFFAALIVFGVISFNSILSSLKDYAPAGIQNIAR